MIVKNTIKTVIDSFKTKMTNYNERTRLVNEFFNANYEDVTRAFLDALDCDYYYISKYLVIVKNDEKVHNRLNELSFINPLVYNDKRINKRLGSVKLLSEKFAFSPKYKLNLTLIEENDWSKVTLTNKLLAINKVGFSDPESALITYNNIFWTLKINETILKPNK